MQNHSGRWAEIEIRHKAPEWPLFMGRQRGRAPEELHKRLDHLFAVKNESAEHPDKDLLSKHALITAGLLIAPLIEWAMNHQIGLVINHVEVPWRSHPVRSITKGKKHKDNAERAGEQYDYGDPKANRRILAELIDGLGSALPKRAWKLVREAVDALEALDAGQTMDILAPSKTGRSRGAWSEDQAKLKVIEHVAFLRGTGKKPVAALTEMLEKFCSSDGEPLSESTFKGWWAQLDERLGPEWVRNRLRRAHKDGLMFREIGERGSCPENPAERPGDILVRRHCEDSYGAEALEWDVEKYRKLGIDRPGRRT